MKTICSKIFNKLDVSHASISECSEKPTSTFLTPLLDNVVHIDEKKAKKILQKDIIEANFKTILAFANSLPEEYQGYWLKRAENTLQELKEAA